jgi:RimJ/RimL family protein N-acetyltransferase
MVSRSTNPTSQIRSTTTTWRTRVITGELSAPDGLGYAREYRREAQLPGGVRKATVVGPFEITVHALDQQAELMRQMPNLIAIINREIRELALVRGVIRAFSASRSVAAAAKLWSMLVRRAARGDVEAMAAITATVAEEGSLGAEPPVDVQARADRFREALSSEARDACWVLERDGRVIGHAAVTERTRGVLHLGMAILPAGRGQGGGRALLDAVDEYARGCGAHKIDLEVWVDNGRAVALYASSGYVVEGVRRMHYRRRNGELRSSLVMARFIAPG